MRQLRRLSLSASLLSFLAVCRGQITCSVTPTTCYADFSDGKTRLLASDFMSAGGMTHEKCASACFSAGLPVGGVEYGRECHCGTGFNPAASKTILPAAECGTPCDGDKTQTCGGTDALQILNFTCTSESCE